MRQSHTAPSPAAATARERIVAAAARVWAADPSAPLDAIATAAGVGRATLHRHFAGRAALVRTAALDGIAALEAALDAAALDTRAPADALEAAVSVLVHAGDRLHFVLYAAESLDDADVADAERRVDARLVPVLARALDAGVLHAELPAAWHFRAIEALAYAAWTAVARQELAARDASSLVFETILRGLGGPSVPARTATTATGPLGRRRGATGARCGTGA